jgi:uncharacterized protein YjiS (DUF1127 family)
MVVKQPASTLRKGLTHALKQAWAAYLSRHGRRATVLSLKSLDDHTLKDIGIDRSEIESVVYGEPEERLRRYGPRRC